MEKPSIRIFKENEKLDEAYELLLEKINKICEQYQLTYYELFGILECIRIDLYRNNLLGDEEDD